MFQALAPNSSCRKRRRAQSIGLTQPQYRTGQISYAQTALNYRCGAWSATTPRNAAATPIRRAVGTKEGKIRGRGDAVRELSGSRRDPSEATRTSRR